MSRFSETVMEHFTEPRNQGRLADPDRVGVAGMPGRGRFVVIYLKVRDSVISQATFCTHGCGATIASASMLTELIRGRSCEECQTLTATDLIEALDGLPADKRHSAGFVIEALRRALTAKNVSTHEETQETANS